MLELFSKHSVIDLPQVRVPEPYNERHELHSDDQVSRVLKYIYGNQNIGLIRDEINEQNFFSLYSQAFALGCDRLLDDLRELAVTALLNDQTVLKLYRDAVEHLDTKIMSACTQIIVERFEDICTSDENDDKTIHLLKLSLDNFTTILKSDNLNLVHEETLIELIRKYIAIRDAIPKGLPQSAEETAGADLWALLTDAEKENRNTIYEEEEKKRQTAA